MLGEGFVDADDQRGTLVHPCVQTPEYRALQRFLEVSEDEVAAENQIEGACGKPSTDVSMGETDTLTKLPPHAVLVIRQLESTTAPGFRQVLEAARLEASSAGALEHFRV